MIWKECNGVWKIQLVLFKKNWLQKSKRWYQSFSWLDDLLSLTYKTILNSTWRIYLSIKIFLMYWQNLFFFLWVNNFSFIEIVCLWDIQSTIPFPGLGLSLFCVIKISSHLWKCCLQTTKLFCNLREVHVGLPHPDCIVPFLNCQKWYFKCLFGPKTWGNHQTSFSLNLGHQNFVPQVNRLQHLVAEAWI